MTVLILYNQPHEGHAQEEPVGYDIADADVLAQVAWVRESLVRLGYRTDELAVTLDLAPLDRRLRRQPVEFVVYLVESLGGTDALLHLPAELVEAHGVPLTGSASDVLKRLRSKSDVKERLMSAGLPTPPWLDPVGKFHGHFDSGRYIVKADREHASRGIDQSSVVDARGLNELRSLRDRRASRLGLPCLAEGFIGGREFNISLLADGDGGAEVLPLAEIDFSRLPEDRLPIVDWNAKWSEGSAEYVGTPRKFPDLSAQPDLQKQLQDAATACWQLFGLTSYARVDVRVDDCNRVWILEINANPCLSPDAGFQAACAAAGLGATEVIERLIPASVPLRR